MISKNVFAVHGVDETGKPILVRPVVKGAALLELIAKLAPCLIGVEACSGAHPWARKFAKFEHTCRLMAPRFVTPCRLAGKQGKNDAADAQAICEAFSVQGTAQVSALRAALKCCARCTALADRPCPCARGAEWLEQALQHRPG